MSIDLRLLDILEKRRQAELQLNAPSAVTGGGGDPPGYDGVERRLRALEASFNSIDKTLAVIVEQLKHVASKDDIHSVRAILSGKLDTKASATDLAELKGRVARIPTAPVLVSIGILVSLLFAAASWALRHLPPAWTAALQ